MSGRGKGGGEGGLLCFGGLWFVVQWQEVRLDRVNACTLILAAMAAAAAWSCPSLTPPCTPPRPPPPHPNIWGSFFCTQRQIACPIRPGWVIQPTRLPSFWWSGIPTGSSCPIQKMVGKKEIGWGGNEGTFYRKCSISDIHPIALTRTVPRCAPFYSPFSLPPLRALRLQGPRSPRCVLRKP